MASWNGAGRLSFSLRGKSAAHVLTSQNTNSFVPFSPDSMSLRSCSSGVTFSGIISVLDGLGQQ